MVWELLLSRNPGWIAAAYESLSAEEKKAVRQHLTKMVSEPGWQPEQQESARAALDAIQNES